MKFEFNLLSVSEEKIFENVEGWTPDTRVIGILY